MAQDLQGFFDNIPPVTKFWLVASFLTTLSIMLKVVGMGSIFLDWDRVWGNFEIWRLFTCATFFGKFSFQFLFQLYFLVSYGSLYEKAAKNPKVLKRLEPRAPKEKANAGPRIATHK